LFVEIKPEPKTDYSFLFFFIVLIILKFSGIEFAKQWSWWWVTFPLWAPVLSYVLVIFLYTLVWIISRGIILIYKKFLKNFRK